MARQLRTIGSTELRVSPIALGLWPIAGVTSLGVNDHSSIATIQRAIECGINHIDTAYSYGLEGRSDRVLREALQGDYSRVVVASKVGMYYDREGVRKLDTRPATIRRHCREILDRLGIGQLPLLYLHCADGVTAVEESAECLADLQREGWVRHIGVSNLTLDELRQFASVVRPEALQLPLNMLQQKTYRQFLPWCQSTGVAYMAYWALMKGLLAGAMPRNHRLAADDRRRSYEVYQGQAWERAQDLLDVLRALSRETGWTVARLVLAWTMSQDRVTSVLCGAKTPEQISETAMSMDEPLSDDLRLRIDQALAEHFG